MIDKAFYFLFLGVVVGAGLLLGGGVVDHEVVAEEEAGLPEFVDLVSMGGEWYDVEEVGAVGSIDRDDEIYNSMLGIVDRAVGLGGYSNGFLPESVLCEMSFAPGFVAYCPMVEALELLNEDYRAEFDRDLIIVSAYRDYFLQEFLYLESNGSGFVAFPGYSLHGAGCAIDVGEAPGVFIDWDSPTKVWLDENGYKYGLMQKAWQSRGSFTPEPWHYEFFTVRGGGSLELITREPVIDFTVDLPG